LILSAAPAAIDEATPPMRATMKADAQPKRCGRRDLGLSP
jgi:hypothetical protein